MFVDGKEFASKAEFRDYMISTFYSFKNRVNEAEPLVKKPGEIDGQTFDIGDCDNVSKIFSFMLTSLIIHITSFR